MKEAVRTMPVGGKRLRSGSLVCALLLGACASECGAGSSGSGVNGELGNGDFFYACTSMSDPACGADGMSVEAFPDCILLGGRFRLSYTLRERSPRLGSNADEGIGVVPGSQSFFTGTSELQAIRVGRSVFLAREGDFVIDMLHRTIAEPTDVRFRDLEGRNTGVVQVAKGDVELVRVTADASACATPGGALPVEVVGGDPSIATADVDGGLEVFGVEVGTTTFLVRIGELERELEVTVTPGPVSDPPRRQPPDATDATSGTDDTSGTSGTSGDGTSEGTDEGTSDGEHGDTEGAT
jgi:hypothetical protein